MSYPGARARAQAPVPIDDVLDLPLDPATGYLGFSGTFVPLPTSPTVIIYSTAGAGENSSAIPAAAPPAASIVAIYAHLIATAGAPTWIQLHLGPAAPLPGATPLLVGDIVTPVGGNTQFVFPEDQSRASGFFVMLSTTQDTYADPGVPWLVTRALGR